MLIDSFTHDTVVADLEAGKFRFLIEVHGEHPTLNIVYATPTGVVLLEPRLVDAFGAAAILSDLLPELRVPEAAPALGRIEVGGTALAPALAGRDIALAESGQLIDLTPGQEIEALDAQDSAAVSPASAPPVAALSVLQRVRGALHGEEEGAELSPETLPLPAKPLREITSNEEVVMPADQPDPRLAQAGFTEVEGAGG